MSNIKIMQLKKSFKEIEVLKGVSLTLNQGLQYVVKGPSGSGKSTLFYLMGGLDRPTSGEILIGGESLYNKNDEDLALFRNQFVGFVFQFHFLLASMNCLDNILLPARIGHHNISHIKKAVEKNARLLGVEHCLEKFPYELSGGEQQRVNIIRATSLRPKLLLCDEPTGSLDSKNSKRVIDLVRELAESYGATLVIVTHDEKIAGQFDHHFELCDGRLV